MQSSSSSLTLTWVLHAGVLSVFSLGKWGFTVGRTGTSSAQPSAQDAVKQKRLTVPVGGVCVCVCVCIGVCVRAYVWVYTCIGVCVGVCRYVGICV